MNKHEELNCEWVMNNWVMNDYELVNYQNESEYEIWTIIELKLLWTSSE